MLIFEQQWNAADLKQNETSAAYALLVRSTDSSKTLAQGPVLQNGSGTPKLLELLRGWTTGVS